MKRYKMPKIAPEGMVPQVAELVAFTQALTKQFKALSDEKIALRKELSQLKKEAARARRFPK
jgi:cell division protein FtsB